MLRLVKIVGCLLLMCVLVTAITARVGLSQPGAAKNAGTALKNPVKSSPQSIEAGQKAYQTSCALVTAQPVKAMAPSQRTFPSNRRI